jgi:hypothetical protein
MQLKFGEILSLVEELRKQGMSIKEIKELPVYIGDDEELNGIHNAYFVELQNSEDSEFDINELIDNCSTKLNGKAVLIS